MVEKRHDNTLFTVRKVTLDIVGGDMCRRLSLSLFVGKTAWRLLLFKRCQSIKHKFRSSCFWEQINVRSESEPDVVIEHRRCWRLHPFPSVFFFFFFSPTTQLVARLRTSVWNCLSSLTEDAAIVGLIADDESLRAASERKRSSEVFIPK